MLRHNIKIITLTKIFFDVSHSRWNIYNIPIENCWIFILTYHPMNQFIEKSGDKIKVSNKKVPKNELHAINYTNLFPIISNGYFMVEIKIAGIHLI